MPHKEFKNSIAKLKTELEQTPKETVGLEETLAQASEGLDRFTPETIHDFAQALQHEAEAFEVEHPRITALINQVLTALSDLGI